MKFDFSGDGALIQVSIIGYERETYESVSDGNWLLCDVIIKFPNLSSKIRSTLTVSDLKYYYDELIRAVHDLKGEARFIVEEGWANINVSVSHSGLCEVSGFIIVDVDKKLSLNFSFLSDQTYLSKSCVDLASILKSFPARD